jgi:O-antigen/teichoic acid export membrane protein
LGRRALTAEPAPEKPSADLAALAHGGRLNFFGFVLRLAARLPFLFIAGRSYGAEALGRFAYAVLIVELAAQLSTLGLKRGLAQLMARNDRDHACVVADAMLVSAIGSVVSMIVLGSFPQAMFPNSQVHGLDWLLPITVLAISWTDIALSALAYRHDVGATVRARSIVEPWTISIVAFAWSYISIRDGLIISYVFSMVAALIAALVPLLKSYGLPHGWKPDLPLAWRTARRNMPLAAADAVEWGSRRVDIAVLGLFLAPAYVGIYYVAQQVASLPSKLKTSFEPVLGPVIARNVAAKDYRAVARQVRQVGFWILAAQAGIALSLAIPGRGVMGLVGSHFTGGTATLAFLLAAEVVAATAVVSEAALIYVARHRNMVISLLMLAIEAALSVAFIMLFKDLHDWLGNDMDARRWQMTGPAAALCLSLGFASIVKSRLLAKVLGQPVSGWRWDLLWAAAAGLIVGIPVRIFLPEWAELALGIPLILGAFCAVLWYKGFGPEDRELFKLRKAEIEDLATASEADKDRV